MYLIGQTGTGKSALLKNIMAQDIRSGAGVCFIDPHGTDVLDILSIVPPERIDDVIYFDPGSTERPMGLNMLEYDVTKPEQKRSWLTSSLGYLKNFSASA
jgi:type IV secretory pathway VirB4 component